MITGFKSIIKVLDAICDYCCMNKLELTSLFVLRLPNREIGYLVIKSLRMA